MRLVPVIGGALLALVSIPAYYFAPYLLSQTVHAYVNSMTGSNSLNSLSMLRQMGYPPLSVVIPIFQYMLIGLAWAGIGFVAYGLVAKKKEKPIPVKVVSDEQLVESYSKMQQNSNTRNSQANRGSEQVSFEVVSNVLTKLESELKDIKTGYENHKQTIEEEKRNLEQKERERLAKIIATGEVLIKEISPEKFEERVNYYIGLKNDETGHPVDLSLLAEKFQKMKKVLDAKGKSDLTQDEFDSFRRFLDK